MLVETVIGALLQVAFDRIVPGGNVFKWISSFFKSKDDDGKAKEPFENLKMLLLSVKAVLGDAEEKQVVDPNVKAWIDMVREVIYDADDLLDKIATVDLQLKLNHGSRSNDAGLKLSSMLVFHKLENGDPSYFPKRVRHLSFSQDMLDTPEKFEPFQELSQLRTFLPFRWPQSQQFNSPTDFDFLLRPLVRLRVLSLSNYAIRSVPKSIQGLKHLRFLNLSSTEIQRIPSFIGSLYNLQTLLLSKCHKLTTLPTNLTDLTKLRHLDVCGTKLTQMPPNFGGLKYLRLLTTFFVSKDNGSRINELGALLQLHGSLSIVKLENVIDGADASEAKLQEMKFLDELELIWTNHVHNLPSDEENVLGHLQPCKYLRKLKIENYGGKRFPNWLGIPSFSNIVSIHLIGCRNCSSLPQLGQLLSLEILHVAKMTRLESVNPDFYGNKNHTRPFRSLKIMSFEDMFEWKYWMPVDGAEFPSLEELKIEKCSRLTGDLSHNLPALNKLVISGCHALVDSLPKVPILQELEIIDCNSWNCLPAVLVQGTRLSKLILSKCQCLQSFPSASFPMLKSLHIDNCRSLELHLTEHSVHHFQKLEDLHLESSCNAVSILPLSFFPGLCNLHIEDSSNLRSLSISADAHQYLQCLEIINCPELVSLPVGGLLTPNLHSLSICGCENLSPLNEWGLHGMQSLVSLKINGNLGQVHSFPDEGLLPSQLASLHISRFEELISLDHAGLQHLTSLKHLEIHDCVKLGNLPAEGLPQSLWSLIIKNCPQLVGHCQMHTGQYWHLISGIEDLVIDK
ncbi:hypothetical protein L6164_023392 [Bauhinia variegata]|uniref:Uncharacterized protein n=1 Tax=Bauhinia variegata TaxID=167791 RepID=A0ACB9MIE7_BAUVA|nr:hypothetical protein L6164_023392 [Bauhinia variegata]